MKRKWLCFWIIYYAVAIAAIIFAAVSLPQYLNFTGFSAFPIVYVLIMALLAYFYPSKWSVKFFLWQREREQLIWGKSLDEHPLPDEDALIRGDRSDDIFASRMYLVCIPFVALFIFFCINGAKIASVLIALLPEIATMIYVLILEKKDFDKQQAEIKKTLEEQKKNEEMGKWK